MSEKRNLEDKVKTITGKFDFFVDYTAKNWLIFWIVSHWITALISVVLAALLTFIPSYALSISFCISVLGFIISGRMEILHYKKANEEKELRA